MEYATRSKCERTVFLLGQLHVKIREARRLEGCFSTPMFPEEKKLGMDPRGKKRRDAMEVQITRSGAVGSSSAVGGTGRLKIGKKSARTSRRYKGWRKCDVLQK